MATLLFFIHIPSSSRPFPCAIATTTTTFRHHPRHRFFCSIPARDAVIDFGRFRGSPLGTLPSRYLRWLARDLRRGPYRWWAEYAVEVLQDPYYKQRLEWEKAERRMKRELTGSMILLRDPEAIRVLQVLGWDVENEAAWKEIDISLLGTTKGGWVPRMDATKRDEQKTGEFNERVLQKVLGVKAAVERPKSSSAAQPTSQLEPVSLREELRRRRQRRNEQLLAQMSKKGVTDEGSKKAFPGRESFLKNVRKNDGL